MVTKRAADRVSIVDLTLDNVSQLGLFCVSDPRNEGFQAKVKWLQKRFDEGLKIKMAIPASTGKPIGFIEYMPAELAWRAVDAPGYLVIHCIMANRRPFVGQGYGSMLLAECINDAHEQNAAGVAALSSAGPWLPDGRIFAKNDFKRVQTSGRYELWVYQLKRAPLPQIREWEARLLDTHGLTLACAHQCPLHAKAIQDLDETATSLGHAMKVVEIKSSKAAQAAPSGTGTFALTKNGRLLADHYISSTRFRAILSKEKP